jgi:replicative DNA helicase
MKAAELEVTTWDALANEDAERRVLACAMLDEGCVYLILPILKPESFCLDSHRRIYRVISELAANGKPVDEAIVADELQKNGQLDSIGGSAYLRDLTDKIITRELARATNVEHQAKEIVDKAACRYARNAAKAFISGLEDQSKPTQECLDGMAQSLLTVQSGIAGRTNAKHAKDVLRNTLRELETQAATQGLVGRPTGLYKLDKATGGIRGGELFTIAARSGRGKTALGVQILLANGRAGIPACAFSIEMQETEIGKRILAARSEKVSAIQLRNPQSINSDGWLDLAQAAGEVGEQPIWIDDSPSLTLTQLIAKATLYVKRYGIRTFIVDYVRLITKAPGHELSERIANIADALRQFAKREHVAVVLLSQLRKAAKGYENDPPTTADIKETGDIESHSHVVVLIHLPVLEDQSIDPEGQQIIIGKNRNGYLGAIRVKLDERSLQFFECQDLKQRGRDATN